MRLSLATFLPFLLSPLVFADDVSIIAALQNISDATTKLNDTVTGFPSKPLLALGDVIPLLLDSTALLHAINSATDVASSSEPLTALQSIGVAQATLALQSSVSSTLSNLIAAKPKFDKLLIVSPTVLLNLKLEKEATDKFGAAVVEKVPAELQATAKGLLVPIDAAFDGAINVYS